MPGYAQPTLETARLVLRPFVKGDAEDLAREGGAREIARMTLRVPHPYELGMAEQFIGTMEGEWKSDASALFAMIDRGTGMFAGICGLTREPAHRRAELGYWVAMGFWGKGYATEGGGRLVDWGFEALELARVNAHAFGSNPASLRVLEKIGMKHEGCLRKHILKWDQWEDMVMYGVLREEWEGKKKR